MNIYVDSYICRFRYIFDLIFTYITDERWCIHWERKRGYVIFQIKNILSSPVQKWVNNCTWDWTRKWDPYLMTSKMWPKIHQGIYWYVKLWGSGTSMQYYSNGSNRNWIQYPHLPYFGSDSLNDVRSLTDVRRLAIIRGRTDKTRN